MILTHLFLQAVQQPIFITPEGSVNNGPNTWIILCAVGAAILAIGGLIAWIIKLIVPKMLDAFDKRTDALTKVVDSVPAAIDKIPVAIDKVSVLITEVRTDIKTTISGVEDRVISAIQDQKLKDISEQLAEHDQKLKDLSPK